MYTFAKYNKYILFRKLYIFTTKKYTLSVKNGQYAFISLQLDRISEEENKCFADVPHKLFLDKDSVPNTILKY